MLLLFYLLVVTRDFYRGPDRHTDRYTAPMQGLLILVFSFLKLFS